MSKFYNQVIKCPKCGKDGDFVIWDSINTALNPEMKEKVLSGEAFKFVCPHCNSTAMVDYGYLYHQAEDDMMVYYVQNDERLKSAEEEFDKIKAESADEDPDYTNMLFRIVKSANQLKEKIFIFDEGLDDRAVELVKVALYSQWIQSDPDLQVREILLNIDEDKKKSFVVRMGDDKWASAEFPQDLYDNFLKEFCSDADVKNCGEYVIDFNWAADNILK